MKKMALGLSIVLICSLCVASALASNTVQIEELGVSLTVPSRFEWITRSDEHVSTLADMLRQRRDETISDPESSNMYFWGIDPQTSVFITLQAQPADPMSKNTSAMSEEEYLNAIVNDDDTRMYDASSGCTIYTTNETKFAVMTIPQALLGQNMTICISVEDGVFYAIGVLGTDDAFTEVVVELLMNSFKLNKKNTNETATKMINFCNTSFSVPQSWNEDEEQSIQPGWDAKHFSWRAADGTIRYSSVYITDLCTFFGTRELFREVFNKGYAKTMAEIFAEYDGVDKNDVKKIIINDRWCYGYAHHNEDGKWHMARLFTVENGYCFEITLETAFVTNPFEDDGYPILEQIITTLKFE